MSASLIQSQWLLLYQYWSHINVCILSMVDGTSFRYGKPNVYYFTVIDHTLMPSPKHLLAFVCIFKKKNVWIFHIFGDGKTVFICRCCVFCCTHGTIGFNALELFSMQSYWSRFWVWPKGLLKVSRLISAPATDSALDSNSLDTIFDRDSPSSSWNWNRIRGHRISFLSVKTSFSS